MGFTTPDKAVDVAALFPELAGLARTAVRLHPRAGTTTPHESSLGGPLLWPAEEPWPVCTVDHEDPRPLLSAEGQALEQRRNQLSDEMDALATAGDHDALAPIYREFENVRASIRELRRVEYADDPAAALPMVAVAQFYARDIPELPFPEGTDVCQVLWCPIDHEPHYAPRPQVWWRASSTVNALATAPEPDEDSEPGCLPEPCRIAPERVVEFPDSDELASDELRERIAAWEQGQEWKYGQHLSAAPGTKVGGWAYWIQSAVQPECSEGHRMALLLTVASAEHGDVGVWMAEETAAELEYSREVRFTLTSGVKANAWIGRDEQFDAAGFSLFGEGVQPGSVTVSEEFVPSYNSAPRGMDLMLGDVGNLYLFVCPTCPGRPTAVEFQCS